VTLLAGEIGERMVRVPAAWREPSDDEAEIERVAAVALAAMPHDEAAFITWSRAVPSRGIDADKADAFGQQFAAEEKHAFPPSPTPEPHVSCMSSRL
jgi:hypothetical protein